MEKAPTEVPQKNRIEKEGLQKINMARRPTGKLMKAVMQNLSVPILGIDREGKIILCNDKAEELFNIDQKKITGKEIWDVLEITDFTRTFISLVKDSEPSALEQVLPFPGNRIFLVKMQPVKNTDGRIIGAFAQLEDMTAIHKMEKTINDFVATVSHELKTPLTSIKGFVETLLEGALTNPEVTRRFLQVINEETNRMTRLVINLLDLTHAIKNVDNIGRDKLDPINTSRFIKDAASLFAHLALEKGVDFKVSIPNNLPTIRVNGDKIRQVIINLVDNAIKYTSIKKDGEKREVELIAEFDENHIYIFVKDTGVGIPVDEVEKVFDKFYRVKKGPATKLGGTGLGLSITREILSNYGGSIEVESTQGINTTFKVTLPVKNEED